ncbi:MAG TPA: IS5/IS1182 family transposase, partial [Solirubrobacteraceae bacterium]
MARPLVSDELWEIVEPLIPNVARRFKHPGRKRIPDRQVLTGIL